MTTKAKFWISRLGSNHHLKTLSIKVCPTWPPSTTHDLLTMLSAKSPTLITSHSPKAGLQSFSFHVGGVSHAIGELQRILNEVLAFAHLNRMNLATFELKLPAFITFPLPLHVFLSMFPLLKELKLQGERGQLLSLMQSEDFFRTSFSTSQTTHGVSSFSGNDSHNSSLAQSVSVGSTGTDQHGICLDSGLETLFLQCASFIPSTDGPLKVASLRSVSLISTIFDNGRAQSANSNQYVPEIDFTCLQWLENLELSRVASGQQQWEPIWRSCERLPRLKRLRLEGLPHFIPHFLDLANVPEDWSPRDHVDQPFRANTKNILPQIECLCLSSIDSLMCYKFLAIFGCQFLQLDSLSVVGLSLDSTTEPFLINALRHLPPLVNLNLSNTHASSDLIDAIKPDRLQHLQLTNCTRVTFRSLARLMSHRLTLLDITGCQLISTREMIEWLAQRVDCLVWQAGQTSNGKAAKRLFLD